MVLHQTRSMDFSLPFLIVVTLPILVLLFISKILQSTTPITEKKHLLPPEAAGAWPIIGHLHQLKGPKLPQEILGDLADKHGPAFSLRLGVHRAVVVSSWKLAKELFTTNDMAVSSRPKLLAAQLMGYDNALFGFAPYGPYWREIRKLTTIQLLSVRRLQLLKHIQISESASSIKNLYKFWKENKDENGRAFVDMTQLFNDLNLNVIVQMVAGKRMFGTGDETLEKEARQCQKVMREFMRLFGAFVVADYIPFMRWFDIGGYEKRMKETARQVDGIMQSWLDEHYMKRKSGEGKRNHEQDFMDVMLSVIKEDVNLHAYDADRIIKSTCMAMIIGGTDTAGVMLSWALALLLNHGYALRKVQKEIDDHVGKDRPVNELDISNLPYLQAVIKETFRLFPAGSLGVREFTENSMVGGFDIPKGTRLMVNIWKLQRDPEVWEEPSRFRPERFLDANKDVDLKGQHFELIPFGAGRRICPGMALSLQIMQLVIANFLQAFDFSTDTPVDMTECSGLTNSKAHPLAVLVSPRLSPTLYDSDISLT